jgi:hypothetical protein
VVEVLLGDRLAVDAGDGAARHLVVIAAGGYEDDHDHDGRDRDDGSED